MMQVERHSIEGTPEIVRLCSLSRELYNHCNYILRQAYFSKQRIPDISTVVNQVQELDCFKQLHNTKTAKQTIRKCLTDWTNFKKAVKAYYKDKSKFVRKPKAPYYKNKLAQVIFYNETIKRGKSRLKENGHIVPTNNCFSIITKK
jgi:hypothetical protein